MPAIPMPDQGSQSVLDSARSNAEASLQAAYPGQNTQAMLHPAAAAAPANPDAAGTDFSPTPPDDATDMPAATDSGAPPKSATPMAPAQTHGNGDLWSASNLGDFLRDEFKGTPGEVGSGVMRAFAKAGDAAYTLTAGAAAAAADHVAGALLGTGGKAKTVTGAEDAVFDFKKKYFDSAVEAWTPKEAAVTGQGQDGPDGGAGGAAQALGGAAELAPNLVTGGAGLTALIAGGGVNTATQSMDEGKDLRTSVALGLTDTIGTALQAMVPGHSLAIVKRLMIQVPYGDLMSAATDLVKKKILETSGHQEEADKINPLSGGLANTLNNIVFGVLGGKGKEKTAAPPPDAVTMPPAKPVEGNDQTTGTTVGPNPPGGVQNPAPPPVAPTTQSAAPPVVKATQPTVPDAPTPEPMKDLRAQLRDMNDPATPRTGVFITSKNLADLPADQSETAQTVQRQLDQATKTGRVIQMPQGSLIAKDKATALKAQQALKTGTDPQVIIGKLTGAGDGKQVGDAAVVQGVDPQGAVATETTVAPSEVRAAVQDVKSQGKTPLVTTPEAAVQRRADEIAAERSPQPGHTDMPAAEPAEETAPTADRGIVTTAAGDRAVIIHDRTPDADGKVRVSPLDEDGEPGPEIKVPADKLKASGEEPKYRTVPHDEPVPPAPTPPDRPPLVQGKDHAEDLYEAQVKADADAAAANPNGKRPPLRQGVDAAAEIFNEKVKNDVEVAAANGKSTKQVPSTSGTPMEQLQSSVDNLVGKDIPPNGKKWIGKIPERAANIAEFARTLKAVAGSMDGDDAQHAYKMASKAAGLDLKTAEAMAKNQGIGHTELNAHRENMLAAARKLIDPEFERPEPIRPRQVKLKEKVAAKKAATVDTVRSAEIAKLAAEQAGDAAPVKPLNKFQKDKLKRDAAAVAAADEAKKTKVIADVPDETKPVLERTEPTKGQKFQLKAVSDLFTKSKDEDMDAAGKDVQKVLREIYGPAMSKDDVDAFMYHLRATRAEKIEARRPKSRDEEIEDEFSHNQRHGDDDHDDHDALEHRVLGAHEVDPDVADLHKALEENSFYPQLRQAAKDSVEYKANDILNEMAQHAVNPDLQSFIRKIAANVPDQTILRPVDQVVNASTGQPMASAGLFQLRHNLIQVKSKVGGDARMTHTILHEATHAATFHLIVRNPDHPLIRQANNLRDVLINRLRAQYGDMVDQHIAYYNKKGEKPTGGVYNNLYGLMNTGEFMAEAASNGKFRELIAKSDKYRQDGEGYIGTGKHGLAARTLNVLKKILGLNTHGEGQLLHSVMKNVEDTMAAQTTMLHESREDAISDLHTLSHLDDDPKPLREEGRLRGIVGPAAMTATRQFVRAISSGAVHSMRRLVMFDSTHDHLVRTNLHAFGENNEANPLKKWDAIKGDHVQIQNKVLENGRPAVIARQRLSKLDNTKLGQIQIDTQQWGFNPDLPKDKQLKTVQKGHNFDARFDDFEKRWQSLSPAARDVFHMESAHNSWKARLMRRTGVDAALDTFSDKDVTSAQRSLLYSARTKGDFDSLIGQGKAIDVGDRNDALKASLQELAGLQQVQGHFFHLGRVGDYVVEVKPNVARSFDTQAEAEAHADQIRALGPNSKVKVQNLGDKWEVNGNATYLSMHNSAFEAEAERAKLLAQGHDVSKVTNKIESQSSGALGAATQNLVAEANRKLAKRGSSVEATALGDALRGTFVQMVADRSAYAASKLARKGFGGVKPEEMGRNFAAHTQSAAWNVGNLATTFRQGEALGKLREMTKDDEAPQATLYKRGALMHEMGRRVAQEVSQYGLKNPVNAVTAKLGYANYLASPAHTLVNATQNFTTAMPVAGARWGYGKSAMAFGKATRMIAGPTFRSAMKAFKPGSFNVEDMADHVIKAVAKDPQLGKWAPHLRQLLERGVINSSFSNEIGVQANGANHIVESVFEYARILPQMAEVYNRVSTALAGLELTNGDIAKAGDFVRETHVDYTQQNKARLAKTLAKVPGANTVTMFRTYIHGMTQLLYSNIKSMVDGQVRSRGEAAKTVAGLIFAQSLFAGAVKGALIEPVKLAVYAYNKIFGDDDDYIDLDNATRRFLADAMGRKAGDAVAGGLPHLLGFDLSSRMGLSDLFLHNPPDLLKADTKEMMQFLGQQLGGPIGQLIAEQKDQFSKAMDRGDTFGMFQALVPIKFVRDLSKAYDLGTTGKRTGNGGQLTDPSALNAAYQAIGLKPAEVERAQEKQSTVMDYKAFTKDRKADLMNAYSNSDDKGSIMAQVRAYNAANPGSRISYQDFVRQQRSAARTTQEADGREKDPVARDLTDY